MKGMKFCFFYAEKWMLTFLNKKIVNIYIHALF